MSWAIRKFVGSQGLFEVRVDSVEGGNGLANTGRDVK
jgi:hypothetical protein